MEGFPDHPKRSLNITILADKIKNRLYITHQGKDNAIHSKQLEIYYNVKGSVIRKAMNLLRSHITLIGSCSNGYYWIISQEELDETIGHFEERIKAMANAKRGIEKAWRNRGYQRTLFV